MKLTAAAGLSASSLCRSVLAGIDTGWVVVLLHIRLVASSVLVARLNANVRIRVCNDDRVLVVAQGLCRIVNVVFVFLVKMKRFRAIAN